MEQHTTLALDAYSTTLSRLLDNPTATTKTNTVNTIDLLRHTETWVVQQVCHEGNYTAFLQRVNQEGGLRLVLPPAVVATLVTQRVLLQAKARRRAARQGAETRRARRGVANE